MFLKTYHPFKDTLTKSNSTHSLQLVTYSKTFGSNGKKNQVHIRSMLFLMFYNFLNNSSTHETRFELYTT
jgi:hypothetical protein